MNGVSVEGMEEFKVQSSSYSAEFGRTSNGVINWVIEVGNQPDPRQRLYVQPQRGLQRARIHHRRLEAADRAPVESRRQRGRADLHPQGI